MSVTEIALTDQQREAQKVLRTYWLLLTAYGASLLLLGVSAILAPSLATLAINLIVGCVFLASGVLGLVGSFAMGGLPGFFGTLLAAILACLFGAILLFNPTAGIQLLTLLMAAFFIAEGVLQVTISLQHRALFPRSWGWMMLSGLADLVLAAVLLIMWPDAANWALGLLAGINLLTSGMAIMVLAFGIRKMEQV